MNPKELDWYNHSQGSEQKVNDLSKVVWKRNILATFAMAVSPAEQVSQTLRWTLKSPKTDTLAGTV